MAIAPPMVWGAMSGCRRHITICWPSVHRLVVIQYTARPAGKRATMPTNSSGRASIRPFCPPFIARVAIRLPAICDARYAVISATSTAPVGFSVSCGMNRKPTSPNRPLFTSWRIR